MKSCVICGNEFQTSDWFGTQLTCSDECGLKKRRAYYHARMGRKTLVVQNTCVVCCQRFEYRINRHGPHPTTCSIECKKIRRNGVEPRRLITCIQCGNGFFTRGLQKLCSDACKDKRQREREISYLPPAFIVIQACIICGKSFVKRETMLKKTCSESCRRMHENDIGHHARQKNSEARRNNDHKRWLKLKLAHETLKRLGMAPDHLPTLWQNRILSYRIIKQHFPEALIEQKEKLHD